MVNRKEIHQPKIFAMSAESSGVKRIENGTYASRGKKAAEVAHHWNKMSRTTAKIEVTCDSGEDEDCMGNAELYLSEGPVGKQLKDLGWTVIDGQDICPACPLPKRKLPPVKKYKRKAR